MGNQLQNERDIIAQEPECYAHGLRVEFRAVSTNYLRERFNGAVLGTTQWEEGIPVVYYDIETLCHTPPAFSRFVLNHEGAHRVLGHYGTHPAQEFEADGAAFIRLFMTHGYGRREIDIIREMNDRLLPPDPITHPSNRERHDMLLEIYERLRRGDPVNVPGLQYKC